MITTKSHVPNKELKTFFSFVKDTKPISADIF